MRSNEPEAAWAKAEVTWAQSRSGDIRSKAPVGGTAFEQGVTERAPGQAGRSQERRGTGCRNGAWDEAPEETLLTTHTPAHLPEAGGAPRHLGLGRRPPRNGAGSMGQNGPPAPGMSRKEEKPVSVRR